MMHDFLSSPSLLTMFFVTLQVNPRAAEHGLPARGELGGVRHLLGGARGPAQGADVRRQGDVALTSSSTFCRPSGLLHNCYGGVVLRGCTSVGATIEIVKSTCLGCAQEIDGAECRLISVAKGTLAV